MPCSFVYDASVPREPSSHSIACYYRTAPQQVKTFLAGFFSSRAKSMPAMTLRSQNNLANPRAA
jgi:hypothetical protein